MTARAEIKDGGELRFASEMAERHPLSATEFGLGEAFLKHIGFYDRAARSVLRSLTSDNWPLLVHLPGGLDEEIALDKLTVGTVCPIFESQDYAEYREGFPVGVDDWRIMHLGITKTHQDDFDANYCGASFAIKVIMWNGKDGVGEKDALYRILLRETANDQLEAVGAQWFADYVLEDGDNLWGEMGSNEICRLLTAMEGVKRIMGTEARETLEVSEPARK